MADSKKSLELAAVFAKAAEIAKAVPDNLQEIAFQRALDALLTPASATSPPAPQASARPPQSGVVAPLRTTSTRAAVRSGDRSRVDRLIDAIDRTEGAQIVSTGRVLDKALLVLRAAHRHDIHALTPGDIAKVLTDKFRERTSAAAVRMALGADNTYTDRNPEGSAFVYRLMAPGERHLEALESGSTLSTRARSRPGATRKAKPTVSSSSASAPSRQAPKAAKSPNSGRPGPKAVLETLISQGYFDAPHAVGEVIEHLQSKKGHRYKATDLSPALARLLREEKLDRDRDANGQYRYVRKS